MGVRSYVGKVQTNPSTLYMDGTSPITVKIQATSEELREMHNHKVLVVVYVDENDNVVEPATHPWDPELNDGSGAPGAGAPPGG